MEPEKNQNDLFKITDCPSDALLLAYVKGKVSKEEQRLIELHLIDCEMCNDMVEGYQLMPKENIETNIRSVSHQIDQSVAKVTQGGAQSKNFKWLYAAAALILVALTGVLYNQYFTGINENRVADLPAVQTPNNTSNEDTDAQSGLEKIADTVENNNTQNDVASVSSKNKTAESKAILREDLPDAVSTDAVAEVPPVEQNESLSMTKNNVDIESSKDANELSKIGSTENVATNTQTVIGGNAINSPSYNWQGSGNTTNNLFATDQFNQAAANKKKPAEATTKALEKKSAISQSDYVKEESAKAAAPAEQDDEVNVVPTVEQLMNQKKYNRARAIFSDILIIDPNNCKALLGLAQCDEFLKRTIDALRQYKTLSEARCGKDSDAACLKVAELYLKNKQPDEAQKYLQKALKSKYLDIAEQAKKELDKLK
jgi:hypothetical protein